MVREGGFTKAELTYLLSRAMHTTTSVRFPVPQPYLLLQLQQLSGQAAQALRVGEGAA